MYQMIDQMHHVIHQSAVIAKMLPEPSQQILSCHKYLCQVPNKTHEPQIYNTMQCQWSSYREMYVLTKFPFLPALCSNLRNMARNYE
jgi:hypothetical protein